MSLDEKLFFGIGYPLTFAWAFWAVWYSFG
jgi:hypothetical protein